MAKLAYQLVYEKIRSAIEQGVYPADSFLPVEADLEKAYHVSRTTIRKAMKLLAEEQFVEITQGRGTTVKNPKAEQNFNHVTSVTESLKRRGYQVTTKGLFIDVCPVNELITRQLHLSAKDQVIRVQRIQCADGTPVCIMTNYIASGRVPGMLEQQPEFTAFYQYVEDTYGVCIDQTSDTIYAGACSFYEAQILQVSPGAPMMMIDRICYDSNGSPVCRDEVKILANWYQIQISTRGRQK